VVTFTGLQVDDVAARHPLHRAGTANAIGARAPVLLGSAVTLSASFVERQV
jgi:hypothetical protein